MFGRAHNRGRKESKPPHKSKNRSKPKNRSRSMPPSKPKHRSKDRGHHSDPSHQRRRDPSRQPHRGASRQPYREQNSDSEEDSDHAYDQSKSKHEQGTSTNLSFDQKWATRFQVYDKQLCFYDQHKKVIAKSVGAILDPDKTTTIESVFHLDLRPVTLARDMTVVRIPNDLSEINEMLGAPSIFALEIRVGVPQCGADERFDIIVSRIVEQLFRSDEEGRPPQRGQRECPSCLRLGIRSGG
ncbi:Uu.00g099840.m01.CDS01 [Anthostomella pinea]|uniref:Uu.00g099840.m01.CDS01 n=1 Tax=Anthostomella pinea TaxID=933095 RepID=A0AAI8YF91_9PEZI|nr:Uu.00g099840.m01.CDS01 [Anthostomella pinea]